MSGAHCGGGENARKSTRGRTLVMGVGEGGAIYGRGENGKMGEIKTSYKYDIAFQVSEG